MSKQETNLLIAILLISFFLLTTQLDAYQPIVNIGKPPLRDILYSPDGSYLATLTPAYLEFLRAETFEPVLRIDDTNGNKLAFSPDSSLLAVYDWKNGIQIWDIDSQSLIETISVKTSTFAFSPDGKYLAYADGDSVFLWDVAEKKTVGELTGDPKPFEPKLQQSKQRVTAIAFHPNGKTLAVSSVRRTIALWNIETREIVSYLGMKGTYARAYDFMRFSHDGSLLATISTGSMKLWNVATEDARYWGHGYLYDVIFTPDDQYLLTGNGEGTLFIIELNSFDVEERKAVGRLPPPNSRNNSRLERLTLHPDGKRFVSLINDSRIVIWDAHDFSRLRTLYGWAQHQSQAAYLPKVGRIVTGIYTNVLHFWDSTTGELLETVEFYTTIWQLKASPDGQKFAVDVEATNQVWDAKNIKPLHVFQLGGYLATEAIASSSSGKYFASNNYLGTSIWDTKTGEEINQIGTGWSDFTLLMFTLDEQQILLIPPDEEKVVFWDIKTGKRVREINHLGPIVRFRDTYLQVRDRDYKTLEVVRVDTNKSLCKIPKLKSDLKEHFYTTRFHPSGNILAIRNFHDGYNFYDSQTGELLSALSIKDFHFVGNGEYMFITDNKYQLGLYKTSEVLDLPETVNIEPLGKKATILGEIKQNQLFQNYPNPFNPETWIPFQIAEDAQVSIRIYSSFGQLVRELSLGRLSAGEYVDKDKAVYWDGRNKNGEEVSSGVYFYQIQAEDWSETKKLVIIR